MISDFSSRSALRHRLRAGWADEARALIALATPMVGTQLAQMAIGTTDLLLLGRFSQSALAAMAIGSTVYWFCWLLGGGPASAVSPMIAHIRGERSSNRGGIRAATRMGVWAVLLTTAAAGPVLWNAEAILRALGQQPELAHGAGLALRCLSIGLPFALTAQVMRNFSVAMGRPRAGLWVALATILFNAVAGWVLIFGRFGVPRLGLAGSGLATSASSIFGFLAMLLVIRMDPYLAEVRIFRRFGRAIWARLAEIFRLGLPIGATMMAEAMLFNAMTLLMGTFGAQALAAHQIAMNLASITYMVPLGVGMASTVRVGLAAGAGDVAAARRAGQVALTLGGGFMAVCGLAMMIFGRALGGLYLDPTRSENAAVLGLVALFLRPAAAFQLFDGLQTVGAQTLRGLKDARMPMLLAMGAYWAVGAPVCIWLAVGMRMGGLGIWIGFVICLAVAAIAMVWRFVRLTDKLAAAAR